jgi:hypothetical protein
LASRIFVASSDQAQQVLTEMGIPPKGAAVYIEMYKAINSGVVAPPEPRLPENNTPTSFEEFVQDLFAQPPGERPPPATS